MAYRYKGRDRGMSVIEAASRREAAAEVVALRREGWHREGRLVVYRGNALVDDGDTRVYDVQVMERDEPGSVEEKWSVET